MATEPDDYQTISDNCPGYMVLVAEGIICTRCAGEKRHKPKDCPKTATAAELATDSVTGADEDGHGDGTDNADSGMESLSDADSVSSESTARSDRSDIHMTDAHHFDQSGNRPQDTHLPRRGFARLDASRASIQPDRSSLSSPNYRAARESSRVNRINRTNGHISNTATDIPETQSPNDPNIMYDPSSPQSAETYPSSRSGPASSPRLPSNNKHSSLKKWNDKTKKRSHAHDNSIRQARNHEAMGDRLPSKSLADTTRKFDYSNTTCPSSFGFGRLPSEAMG